MGLTALIALAAASTPRLSTRIGRLDRPGDHVRLNAELVGPADVVLTLDVYAHLPPGFDADAADRLDDTCRGMSARLVLESAPSLR